MKRDDRIDARRRQRGCERSTGRALEAELDAQGWAVLPRLLTRGRVRRAAPASTPTSAGFRSRVVMARHGFGRGEYRYFAYPLPPLVQGLRTALYPRLAPIANRWHERMGMEARFPAEHAEFLARCHAAGQTRPTPLLLQYGAGDYNCLHQDLYGEHVFPLQVAVLLSEPGDGLQRRRVRADRAAAAHAVARRGRAADARATPWSSPSTAGRCTGTRGDYRVNLRHGVSTIATGHRHTLGIIFHDAS